MRKSVRLGGALALALAMAGPAAAGPYSGNVIFGDSLSDNGNLADALGYNLSSPPFFHDSFTNGEVAVAVLDDRLGLSTNPSLFPTGGYDIHGLGLQRGTNFAVAGATSSDAALAYKGGVPGANLTGQVNAFLGATGNVAPSSFLYTVFIGGNDVRAAAHNGAPSLVDSGVATELAELSALIKAGATNFLVVNVPDIGTIPETRLVYPGTAADATTYTDSYNKALFAGIGDLRAANSAANIAFFDLNAFSKQLITNAASYGITDTTNFCYTYSDVTKSNGSPYAATPACGLNGNSTGNIDHLAFWDAIHPTSVVQTAIGNQLYATVIAAVPEPGSWATMLVGFGVLGGALRRRRERARVVFQPA